MPQWYYHNSNVLPLHRPRSSIMYNRNVTQSDSKMYYLHESSCHLQFMRELSIQSTGLAGVGSTVNLFRVKASSNTQHCKIIIIKKKKKLTLSSVVAIFFSTLSWLRCSCVLEPDSMFFLALSSSRNVTLANKSPRWVGVRVHRAPQKIICYISGSLGN